MITTSYIFQILFYIALFISVIETIGTHLLYRNAICFGIPLFRRTLDVKRNESIELNKIITKEEGKFRFLTPEKCIFTSRLHLLKFFRIQTPFPVKGTIEYGSYGAELVGRIPSGITFWSIIVSIDIAWPTSELPKDFNFLVIAVLLFIFVQSYFIEKHRLKKIENEFIQIVNQSN